MMPSPWAGTRRSAETQKLVDLLLAKNPQGLRQLKFMSNKNVEAELYTAQGVEGLLGRLMGDSQVCCDLQSNVTPT